MKSALRPDESGFSIERLKENPSEGKLSKALEKLWLWAVRTDKTEVAKAVEKLRKDELDKHGGNLKT